MSYWVSVVIPAKSDPDFDLEAFNSNITYNLSPMFREAGLRLFQLHDAPAVECSSFLMNVIRKMEDDEEKFMALNPENDWGTYDEALVFLKNFLQACVQHPNGRVRVH